MLAATSQLFGVHRGIVSYLLKHTQLMAGSVNKKAVLSQDPPRDAGHLYRKFAANPGATH